MMMMMMMTMTMTMMRLNVNTLNICFAPQLSTHYDFWRHLCITFYDVV